MTQPQQDPPAAAAALARLAEQTTGLQRQATRTEFVIAEHVRELTEQIRAAQQWVTDLTDAKFVTYRTLIDSQAEKVALALDATEKAIGKAEVATGKAIEKESAANADRFRAVNEFRQQLNDQARLFMPRSEAEAIATRLSERLQELTTAGQNWATRVELNATVDRLAERIEDLTNRLNRSEGQGQGAKENRSGLYALIGLAVTVIVGAIALFNFLSARV